MTDGAVRGSACSNGKCICTRRALDKTGSRRRQQATEIDSNSFCVAGAMPTYLEQCVAVWQSTQVGNQGRQRKGARDRG